MSTIWQEIRSKLLYSGSKIGLLIGINVAVYLVVAIGGVFEFLFFQSRGVIDSYATEYLALTTYLPHLAARIWTPLTYMFVHAGFFHILFNMLWLYWMGQIFEEYLGTRRIVGLYILGGLAGALFVIAAFNLIPVFAGEGLVPIVGASASVMAIVVATATLLPNYTIYLMFLGPVKLKWLAIAYVLIDFIGIAGANAGGEIAHLGGALMGFIYIKQLQRGNDWNRPFNRAFESSNRVKVVYRNTATGYNQRTPVNGYPAQDEIDRILDKISHSGYKSLSKQEKETLQRASNANEK
jgi:membrane associated rhomboid family serine protease